MREIIITGKIDFKIKDIFTFEPNDYIIGVDSAAISAIRQNIKLDLAIGDFDSVNQEELELIKKESKTIKRLNPVKDETDTLSALRNALPPQNSKIIMIGGIKGNRIEHFFANVTLIRNYPNLIIMDNLSMIYSLQPGRYELKKDDYRFVSLFALDTINDLTLENFKYPLKNYHLCTSDIVGISNEVNGNAIIHFTSGLLLVIKSKNDA